MALSLRRSGLVSPADTDRPDFLVIEDGKVIGRIYEQRYVPPDVRWFSSITATTCRSVKSRPGDEAEAA